jgi:hypothetical protein
VQRFVRNDDSVSTMIVLSKLTKQTHVDVVSRVARYCDSLVADSQSAISDEQRKRFALHILTRIEAKTFHIKASALYANIHTTSNSQILGKNKAIQTSLFIDVDDYSAKRSAQLKALNMFSDKYIDLERFCDASNQRIVKSTLDVSLLDNAQVLTTQNVVEITEALESLNASAQHALESANVESTALVLADATAKKRKSRKALATA